MNIVKPGLRIYTANRDELFRRVLGTSDFSKAQTGLQIAGIVFSQLFPIIETIVGDNETILIDQAKQMKQFAELDAKYKELVKKHEELKNEYDSIRIELPETSFEASK